MEKVRKIIIYLDIRNTIRVFLVTSMLILNASSPFLVELASINERSLRMLFRSVITSVELISNKGYVTYNARKSGSRGLSGWRAASERYR